MADIGINQEHISRSANPITVEELNKARNRLYVGLRLPVVMIDGETKMLAVRSWTYNLVIFEELKTCTIAELAIHFRDETIPIGAQRKRYRDGKWY